MPQGVQAQAVHGFRRGVSQGVGGEAVAGLVDGEAEEDAHKARSGVRQGADVQRLKEIFEIAHGVPSVFRSRAMGPDRKTPQTILPQL